MKRKKIVMSFILTMLFAFYLSAAGQSDEGVKTEKNPREILKKAKEAMLGKGKIRSFISTSDSLQSKIYCIFKKDGSILYRDENKMNLGDRKMEKVTIFKKTGCWMIIDSSFSIFSTFRKISFFIPKIIISKESQYTFDNKGLESNYYLVKEKFKNKEIVRVYKIDKDNYFVYNITDILENGDKKVIKDFGKVEFNVDIDKSKFQIDNNIKVTSAKTKKEEVAIMGMKLRDYYLKCPK